MTTIHELKDAGFTFEAKVGSVEFWINKATMEQAKVVKWGKMIEVIITKK